MDLSNPRTRQEAELKAVLERLDYEFGGDPGWQEMRSEVAYIMDTSGADEALATLYMVMMAPMMYH